MTDHVKSIIREHASTYPREEVCGIITEENGNLQAFPCRNAAPIKGHYFRIDPLDYIKISTGNKKITGVYHSHISKNKDYSLFDKINCAAHELDYVLYHLPTDSFYQLNAQDCPPFLGRKFEYGKSDCYTLVRDYYKYELKITLPEIDIGNISKWEDELLFEKDYEDAGFKGFDEFAEIKKHDVIVFNFYRSKMPPHFAVYLGNGFILHHPRNAYSMIDTLNPITINKVVKFWRHKNVVS